MEDKDGYESMLCTFLESRVNDALKCIVAKRALDVSPNEYAQLFKALIQVGISFPNISASKSLSE